MNKWEEESQQYPSSLNFRRFFVLTLLLLLLLDCGWLMLMLSPNSFPIKELDTILFSFSLESVY